ncbi:MAG: Decarboxylase NovR [Alphaproteobacteria bacterium MarineAlpha2_Bin1]|nr:MAG: Decarboxylase NovR [Alphaproteobacteria bacterium MarineAlpha2_Bin1]|tara:strand:+ start:279 stop:1052 length:774 start_codon:yes stop_codon:yes gene_type:complete
MVKVFEDIYERARNNYFTFDEWKARVDLAACYQIFEQKGWTDGINTHLSMRIPGKNSHFLLKPDNLMFHEVKASNLIDIDLSGKVIGDGEVNKAGYVIHAAILESRSDINCVLHHHTDAGIAISSLKDGLLPMSQHALGFYGKVSYHDYQGVALDESEKLSLQKDLGCNNSMFLRNHGVIVCGKTVAGAFASCDNLETACRSQLLCQNNNSNIIFPSEEVKNFTSSQFESFGDQRAVDLEWPALLRWLDYKKINFAE